MDNLCNLSEIGLALIQDVVFIYIHNPINIYLIFSDSLTLQLWKDRKDWERHPPSKGSIALEEYLGWEAGFTLDRESNTLALILKSDIISLAFDNRESLIRWQVRVTSQFEEGQHFSGKKSMVYELLYFLIVFALE